MREIGVAAKGKAMRERGGATWTMRQGDEGERRGC